MADLMMVTEEASGTIEEEGTEDVPRLEADGVTPVLDPETHEQVFDRRPTTVRVPVALHKGQAFPKTHRYVKLWPHLFEPHRPTAGE